MINTHVNIWILYLLRNIKVLYSWDHFIFSCSIIQPIKFNLFLQYIYFMFLYKNTSQTWFKSRLSCLTLMWIISLSRKLSNYITLEILRVINIHETIHDKFANFRYLQSYKVTMHFLTYIIRYNETCSGKKEKKLYISWMLYASGRWKERTNTFNRHSQNFLETNNACFYSAILFAICFLYGRLDVGRGKRG